MIPRDFQCFCIFILQALLASVQMIEEPLILNKFTFRLRVLYSEAVHSYFGQFGLLHCRHATCFEFETGLKLLNKVNSTSGMLINECNSKTYYITNDTVTNANSWRECCKYGLVPATFKSLNEIKCIQNEFEKKKGSSKISDTQVWTAHIDSKLDNRFVSCLNDKPTPQELWSQNEPDNKDNVEACAALSLIKPGGLVDLPCTADVTRRVICESLPVTVKSIPKKIAKDYMDKGIISNIYDANTIKRSVHINTPHCMSSFCLREVPFKYVPGPNRIFISDCGNKLYAYGTFGYVSTIEAWKECCSLGMVPINIESKKELECLKKRITLKQSWFATSIIDINLDRNFKSCVTGKTAPLEVWFPGHPYAKKDAACTTLGFHYSDDPNTNGLCIDNCESKLFYLCEYVNATNLSPNLAKNELTKKEPTTDTCSLITSQCDSSNEKRNKMLQISQKLDIILNTLKQGKKKGTQ